MPQPGFSDGNAYDILASAAQNMPYPVARELAPFAGGERGAALAEWEILSLRFFPAVLKYVSHVVLGEMAFTGLMPEALNYRVQSILQRPMLGEYAGFLRETALFYNRHSWSTPLRPLFEFVAASEAKDKRLISRLVNYRNQFAHRSIHDSAVIERNHNQVLGLTAELVLGLAPIENWTLFLSDGTRLMGCSPQGLSLGVRKRIYVDLGENRDLMPLMLVIDRKQELALLDEVSVKRKKAVYASPRTYFKLSRGDLSREYEGVTLLSSLEEFVSKVQASSAIINKPDWNKLAERGGLVTSRTIGRYQETGKYAPHLYIEPKGMIGEAGLLESFLTSEKTVMVLDGEQGAGKSALLCEMSQSAAEQGDTTVLLNAHDFLKYQMKASRNPFPRIVSDMLGIGPDFDEGFAEKLANFSGGQRFLIMIDGVNELDSKELHWDRFAAWTWLMDWACRIHEALPKGVFKILVALRSNAYQPYHFPEADDCPENLLEAMYFVNTPPGHLSPEIADSYPKVPEFEEADAERMYQMLQQSPEMGMAPWLSWEEILSGVGEAKQEIFSNPLIFKLFLQIHHGKDKLIGSSREEILSVYGEQVTGADELRQMPIYKKFLGFLKNGMLTNREIFLADLSQKMISSGGLFVLTEELDPSGKLDKKLLSFIDGKKRPDYETIKEGGVLMEEEIAGEGDKTDPAGNRITVVNEIASSILDTVQSKRDRVSSFRMTTLIVFGVMIVSKIIGLLVIPNYNESFWINFHITFWPFAYADILLIAVFLGWAFGIKGFSDFEIHKRIIANCTSTVQLHSLYNLNTSYLENVFKSLIVKFLMPFIIIVSMETLLFKNDPQKLVLLPGTSTLIIFIIASIFLLYFDNLKIIWRNLNHSEQKEYLYLLKLNFAWYDQGKYWPVFLKIFKRCLLVALISVGIGLLFIRDYHGNKKTLNHFLKMYFSKDSTPCIKRKNDFPGKWAQTNFLYLFFTILASV